MLYGWLVEPYWLEITRTDVVIPGLAKGAQPIRIAQLSDIHCDPELRVEAAVAAALVAEKPDFIVFTGDSINSPGGLANFQALLTQAQQVAPVFAVRGNWDAWYWSGIPLFEGTGVTELVANGQVVTVRGTPLWLAGVAVEHEEDVRTALNAPPDMPVVLLHHYPHPDLVPPDRRVDLMLSGHTHGGQVALPLYGALMTLAKHGKKYESGLYDVAGMKLYVHRGIGMEGGPAPRVRFWARPELAIISLVPSP